MALPVIKMKTDVDGKRRGNSKRRKVKPKKAKPPAIKWRSTVSFGAMVDRADNMKLIVAINEVSGGDEWVVIALEAPKPPKNIKTSKLVDHALDNHAHKNLGTFGFFEALDAAKKYATAGAKRSSKDDPCPCVEFDRDDGRDA